MKIDKSSLMLKQFNFFLQLIDRKKFSNKNFTSSANVSYLIGKLKKSSFASSEIKISLNEKKFSHLFLQEKIQYELKIKILGK